MRGDQVQESVKCRAVRGYLAVALHYKSEDLYDVQCRCSAGNADSDAQRSARSKGKEELM